MVGDIKVHVEPCDHPANQPFSFIITTGSGINLYHPDDSKPFPEMVEIKEKYMPEILLYSGTSLDDGIGIAKLTKPQIVVSYYADKRLSTRFVKEINREVPNIKVRMIKRFEIFQYPELRR